MKERFRLPNGSTSYDKEKYAQEWFGFADKVAELFPGYNVAGVDPDIMLADEKWNSFRLTVDAANALLNEVTRRINSVQLNKKEE